MRKFTKYWIFINTAYVTAVVCMMAYLANERLMILPWAAFILNLCGLMFTYFACCAVANFIRSHQWSRYIPLLIIFTLTGLYCGVDYALIAFPIALFSLIILAITLYTLFRRCQFSIHIRNLAGVTILGHWAAQTFYLLSILWDRTGMAEIFTLMVFLILENFVYTILHQKTLVFHDRLQNDYIRMMAENAVDILFYYTLTPQRHFNFISPSVNTLTEYTQNDFYENPNLYLEITHEEDRKIIQTAFSADMVPTGQNHVRWQKKSGDFIYLEFHNNLIYEAGIPMAIEGILRDITERIYAENKMADATKARQLLLSYVSHELKTPITYITGYAELLLSDLLTSEEKRKNAAELILSKAVYLQHLIEDLFLLSKMEANQYSFDFMQTKVSDLYQLLEEQCRKDLFNTTLSCTVECEGCLEDEGLEVIADIKRMEQVYTNLLQNAMKHTPDNGSIHCRCSLDAQREHVIFQISDSGHGIGSEDMPNIFKAFYKGKTSPENQSGSGLGLSLCQQIITAHRGEIHAVSENSKGSTFYITLPLYTEEDNA